MCLRWARHADFYDAMDRDIVYPNLDIYLRAARWRAELLCARRDAADDTA